MDSKHFYQCEEIKVLTEENKKLEDRILELSQRCEALEDKETPKKVEYLSKYDDGVIVCPNCSREFENDYNKHCNYCPTCGQRLHWSKEDK